MKDSCSVDAMSGERWRNSIKKRRRRRKNDMNILTAKVDHHQRTRTGPPFSRLSLLGLILLLQASSTDAQTDCGSLDYDCNSCISSGCWWCGVEAVCTSSPFVNNIFSKCRTTSDFTRNADTCSSFTISSQPDLTFNDPLLESQEWFLEMMNIPQAWSMGYTGDGVRVRINDSGIDVSHAEFQDKFDRAASCNNFLPSGPSQHGTSVASIVGAAANNGQCGVGVAPDSILNSCNIFEQDDDGFLGSDDKLQEYDISQNSYGFPSK